MSLAGSSASRTTYKRRYKSRNDPYDTLPLSEGGNQLAGGQWIYRRDIQGWRSTRTLLCPTDRAKELATPTDPAMPYRPQCIVLRDRSTKEDMDYDDTPAIEAMRTQLDGFNDNTSLDGSSTWTGSPICVPYLRRIFCDDW